MTSESEPETIIVQSGTWLYDGLVLSEVWIVKQNFEYHYEPGFTEDPEQLNEDGYVYKVVIARSGRKIALGPERLTLPDVIEAAEEVIPSGITWSNHILQPLFGGGRYSTVPVSQD